MKEFAWGYPFGQTARTDVLLPTNGYSEYANFKARKKKIGVAKDNFDS